MLQSGISMPVLIESIYDIFTWCLFCCFTYFLIEHKELLGRIIFAIALRFWLSTHPEIWITFKIKF